MEILFLLPVIFLCLFVLYLLSRNDFVLLRQNISLTQIFDLGFIALFFAFLVSRIVYILNNASFELFNILAFLHILRYPGLSAFGFLLGGIIAIFFLFRKRKGLRRIFDIFAIAFIPVFAYHFLLRGFPNHFFYIPLISMIVFTILFFFFIKAHTKYILRDGTISYIVLFLITTNIFISQLFSIDKWNLIYNLSAVQIVSFILVFISLVFSVVNQKFLKS